MCNRRSTKPALLMSNYGSCQEDVSSGKGDGGVKLQLDANTPQVVHK